MTTLAIGDPASALAASWCSLARWREPATWVTAQHPSRCGWCDYPAEVLVEMTARYQELVEFDERNRTDTAGMGIWRELGEQRRAAAIAVAQDLVDEPPPAPGALVMPIQPADPAPAHAAPGPPAWLGGDR